MDKENITIEQQTMLDEIEKHPLYTPLPESVTDSFRYGWARGLVFYYETLYHGNWYKWLNILGKGEWKGEPYPQIRLSPSGHDDVRKMLKKSFEPLNYRGVRSYEFISWIGYALGLSWFEKPKIDEKSWEHLYHHFDFSLLLKHPSDYLSLFLAESGSSGVLDYFPTPLHITIMMNKMMETGNEQQDVTNTVFEPCVGTGAMILPTKSLNTVASDLSPLMVRAAVIQAFFYKPSMVYVPVPVVGLHADPKELRINKWFEFETDTRIFCGNSLLGEFTCPKNIFIEGSEYVDIYFQALDLEKHDIYKYEEDLEKPWNSLSRERQIEIVAAMAREIPPDNILTNPPFNSKLSAHEKAIIDDIRKRNEVFLEKRAIKERLQMFHQIEEEVEAKIEVVVTNSKARNVDKDQLMFVF